MKFIDDFESFLRVEVNLNQTRLDTLQERVTAIESFVAANATLGPVFIEGVPAGSWAHRTIIKPVADHDRFDADVLLYLSERDDWQPKDYIETLYTAFRDSGTYKDRVGRKTRCMRITYAGEFHIDLVPSIERTGIHYITNRVDPEQTGGFEASNPAGFTAWVDERQRYTKGSFVKVVRLLKYLRDFKDTFSCKSIILTTLLGNQVNEIEAMLLPDRYADVPSTLKTLLRKLADALPVTMPQVLDPGGTGDDFAQRYMEGWNYENFRQWIQYYARKVEEAYTEPDRDASIKAWQLVFGTEFKPGSLAKVSSISPRSASVPSNEEKWIQDIFPVRHDPGYRFRISGEVLWQAGFRGYDLSKRGYQVHKRRELRFQVRQNTVPVPYTLYWKVRNGGEEAHTVNQLRGEITKDSGNLFKKETTKYKGTHFVECYVVKDGIVVASDRQNVIVK